MTPLWWVKHLVKIIVLPPAGPLLVALIGLAVLQRHPRTGRALSFAGVLILALLSTPIAASLLIRALDHSSVFDIGRVANAQAIVIVGGGVRAYAPEYGGETMNTLTLERVRYGARIARATGLPVLVSGGANWPGATEASLMRDALTDEFGVNVRWLETRSHDSHENAVESARILKASGIHCVIVIAHSFDVLRVRAEFAMQGLDTIAAPTDIPSPWPNQPLDFWPSAAGLQASYYAVYEILAMALFAMTHS